MQCEYRATTRSRLQMITYHLLYSVLQLMIETPALNRLAQSSLKFRYRRPHSVMKLLNIGVACPRIWQRLNS